MNVMSAGLLGEIMAVQIMNEVGKPETFIIIMLTAGLFNNVTVYLKYYMLYWLNIFNFKCTEEIPQIKII